MLKPYAVENLLEGMQVGRDVLDADGGILLSAGTVLTQDMIGSLLERPIFSVYIDEEEPLVDIPGREHLLDEVYVAAYEGAHVRVKKLIESLAGDKHWDEAMLQGLVSDILRDLAADGAKAVSQIHNMERTGDYIYHHSLHVAILAALLGRWLGWPREDRRELVAAGLFHDVGKLRIDAALLGKKGKLTEEEFATVRRHPAYGFEMMRQSAAEVHEGIKKGIMQHHERCDGSGYPEGLRRGEISPYGRLIAILDIYDAMAADRVYARRRSPFDIFKVLTEDMTAGRLDPEYTVYFMRQVCRSLIGNWVLLSNGDRGRIVYIAESRVTALPMVQTVHDEFIDLEQRKDIRVEALLTAQEAES